MDILLSVIAELATSLIFLGLASLAVYWALIRGFQPRIAILMGALIVLVYVGGSFAADQLSSHPDSWTSIQQTFDQIWQVKAKALADDKMPQSDIDLIQSIFKEYFLFCLPAWIISGSLFAGFLGYYLVSVIGSKFTSRIIPPMPFWKWMIPEYLVFGLILGGGIKLLAPENTGLAMAGDNLLVLFLFIYTFSGLTITSFYFRKWRFPTIARLLTYALLFELTFNAVCILGIADIWLDFRKLKKPSVEPTP
ncbi:MAG TPA: DUF2232 domain-containing protein [bacterium]|nr:DUF2232 domain-containing protein [bacterium]